LELYSVVAAVIERDGKFLLTLRPDGTHLAGYWEFPGGKCHPRETHTEALGRELSEELGIVAVVHDHVFSVTHEYPEKVIELHFYRCSFEGTPQAMLGQQMQWVAREDLRGFRFPAADAKMIEMLVS